MSKAATQRSTIPQQTARGKGTICIQGAYVPKVGEPRILPVFQSTTYKYDDLEQVERLFALQEAGYKYTRTGNPTVAAFEQKITELEGGTGAVALASGQAANLLAITNIASAGDHVVSASTVYGGTYTLLHRTLKRYGITTTFIDPESTEKELQRAFQPDTKLILAESIGNPGLGILEFETFT